ncbi:LON peptidase N-terminal domain and RING finger protein 2 isoform X2 [Hypanus sabinus]|uniref:LON peptidase N-terminal domain and RING finger protein 2 isoform X2 n=1 Tax=Hypanus sabinus TaxID=79690 RepID=UPI0028C45236|nr:LON peptidase N-terminal domain and RING finger protein 2 isoform X2 [Hypanus sabinus]
METPGALNEILQLADEAFRAKNYALAADIYECQLLELGPERRIYLRKADALCRCDRFSEALEAYQKAADLGRLRPDDMQNLLESITANLRGKELLLRSGRPQAPGQPRAGSSTAADASPACAPSPGNGDKEEEDATPSLLSCRLCLCLLSEPVSLPCGHSFCRRCLERSAAAPCRLCEHSALVRAEAGAGSEAAPSQTPTSSSFRPNVVLCNLMEKWFPCESRARRLQAEADGLLQGRDYLGALKLTDQALSLVPHDYLMLCKRAELYVTLGQYEKALCDGDVACALKPLKATGHFWKAEALAGMGRIEEALKEYLYCLAVRPDWKAVKLKAQKILCDMFAPVVENMEDTLLTNMRVQATSIRPKPTFLSTFSSASVVKGGTAAGPFECLIKVNKIAVQEPNDSNQTLKASKITLGENFLPVDTASSWPADDSKKRKLSSETEFCERFKRPNKMVKKDELAPLTFNNFKASGEIPGKLVDPSDFECSLCMRLFYEPITTSCGHTFCLRCLERSLDHNSRCPLCKKNVAEYLVTRAFGKAFLIEELIVRYLPEELKERKKFHEEEMKELSKFADYGCILEIRDVKFFPDGRSVVDTVGKRRFKVLHHGQRDGYSTANIEYLEDDKVEGAEYNELVSLSNLVYDQALIWFKSLKDDMRTQILNHFGPMPGKEPIPQSSQDGPAWCWWLLAVLPLESRAQLAVLSMTSLKNRLIAIRRVLVFVTRRRFRSL